MGLAISKIHLIGRWFCGVVLHYCRLAPLTTTADEYKRGRDQKGQASTLRKLEKKTDKLQDAIEFVTKAYEQQLKELQDKITENEKMSTPRHFVQNRKSGKTHPALTYYSDVGPEALAYCGYKHGRSSAKRFTTLEGTPYKLMCSTCLKEQRDAIVGR